MKKILSIILVLSLVFALGTTAFATNGSWNGTTHTGNTATVTATYVDGSAGGNAGNIYSVKLTWTDVSVSYKGAEGATYTWNPESLKYESSGGSDAAWSDGTVKIGVENRSNAAITATATYAATSSETLTFDAALDLGSAAVRDGNAISYSDTTTTGTAQSGTITGTMGGSIAESGELGTITVTITTP